MKIQVFEKKGGNRERENILGNKKHHVVSCSSMKLQSAAI